LSHEPALQIVETPGNAHAVASVPSQMAPQGPLPAHGARPPCGGSFETVVHVPSAVGRSQAWHCPVHAESQQCPSTQKPLAHSVALPHTPLIAVRGRQIPAEQ
jgi:hypothetical protein